MNETGGTGSISVTFEHAHETAPDVQLDSPVTLAFDVSPWGGLQGASALAELATGEPLPGGGAVPIGGYPAHYVAISDADGVIAGAVDFYSLPSGVLDPYAYALNSACGEPPESQFTYAGELIVSEPGGGGSVTLRDGETATLGDHLFEVGRVTRNFPEGGSTPWWVQFVMART
jgi:hypothetical protein